MTNATDAADHEPCVVEAADLLFNRGYFLPWVIHSFPARKRLLCPAKLLPFDAGLTKPVTTTREVAIESVRQRNKARR